METTGRVLGVSTVDSTPLEANQLTDPESVFWRAVRFYNKANQRFVRSRFLYTDI